ncbi:MAG TPA: transketolase C-terminal domain-containing protein [Opitutaceae bacterium]|nr:transketolase C-terminal domain-containing protein [Opitutaceae bacterium]HND61287.1 transketolase C-terminal domain-containing protein [Opitutaceae bacterium]
MPVLQYVPKGEFDRVRSEIKDPHERAAVFADLARLNTLYMIMRAGSGHIGSSFSAMDIVTWLYLEAMVHQPATGSGRRADLYFSSKGHDAPGFYAVMLGLGMFPEPWIHQLRRHGGLPGHPDVGTPHVVTNTGSLGMGISKAKGMVHAARLAGEHQQVFVLTGDGELQEGQIWESLVSAANFKMGEIVVIVDHNKIQSDTFVAKVSDLGDLPAKFRSFGWEVERLDGHDVPALDRALRRFATIPDRPKIIIADTIKGRGVSFMEQSAHSDEFGLYRFHSGAPAEDNYFRGLRELSGRVDARLAALKVAPIRLEQAEVPSRTAPVGQRLVGAYSRALLEQAERRPDLVVLDGDLMLDCGLIPFKDRHPQRFIECGIAEMDMVSQAGGLALRGKLPLVHSFSCFLSTRPNEHIYNNATERTKVIYVSSLAGVVPGGPGHSHQSVRDIAALAGVPGLTLLEPACEAEVGPALDWCVNHNPQSSYLRLVSIPVDLPFSLPAGYRLVEGQGTVLAEKGTDVLIIGYGPVLLNEAWRALALLEAAGVRATLVNLPWLNRIDHAWFASLVARFGRVVTLDNHYTVGGQGDFIARSLFRLGLTSLPRLLSIGVEDIPHCGLNPEVLKAHGLDAASLAARIGAFCRPA